MNSIKFNDLYKNNNYKILSFKHYFNYYFQKLSLISLILIFLYLYKKLNKYNIKIILLLIIIFIVLYFIDNYINRAHKCFLLSDEIINNNNIKSIETKKYLLDKPLREFYINSSHNSYIACNQNLDIASLEAIKKILLMGVRCIELDIHEKNNMPVVAHGNKQILTTTYLQLEDCLDIIIKYGFKTSDPLILFIEVLTENDIVLKKINEMIKLKFGNRLLSNEFKKNKYLNLTIKEPATNNYYKQFINEPIKNLLNKIIIINTSNINRNLEDILDDDTSSSVVTNIINSDNKNTECYSENIMKRKYLYGDIYSNFSYNYDPIIHWKNKVNFVSLNFQTFDNALFKNYLMFKNYSFVHFSEISFN